MDSRTAPPALPDSWAFDHAQALFDAAIDAFVANGYEQASINAILKTADMSKGQFYYHFGNKEGLYLALIDALIAQKQAYMAAVMQPADFSGNLFAILATQIRHGLRFAQSYPAIDRFSRSFLREQGHPIYAKAMARHQFEDNAGLNGLIDQALARGDFRQDVDPAFARKLIGMLFSNAADLLNLSDPAQQEAQLLQLIAFMKHGLAPRQP